MANKKLQSMLIPREVFKCSPVAATYGRLGVYRGIYAIQVLRNNKGVCRAVVTDGSALLVVKWTEPIESPSTRNIGSMSVLVPRKAWDSAGKMISKKSISKSAAFIRLQKTHTKEIQLSPVANPNQCITVSVAEGVFPGNWRNTIPKYTPDSEVTRINVNPRLLATLLTAMVDSTPGGEELKSVQLIVPHNPKHAIKIKSNADVRATIGVIMPIFPKKG